MTAFQTARANDTLLQVVEARRRDVAEVVRELPAKR
jgi:hypothetical protein